MIRFDFAQGGPEWVAIRLGIPTASRFDEILTPAKLSPSKGAGKYRNKLLAEWLTGYSMDEGQDSMWMERGRELEPRARAWYELQYDCDVEQVGFILRDDGEVGGSPDGLVGEDGGLEIKCPALHTHIGYMLNLETLEAEYRGQCQGLMYLTGRVWWDLLSFNPELPSVVRRVWRDDTYIAALVKALDVFCSDLDSCKAMLAQHQNAEMAAMRRDLLAAATQAVAA